MPELNEFEYFTTVEETFVRLREKSILLSPLDWTLIESWKDRGVPLHVVTNSIEEVFKNRGRVGRRRVNSLRYCQSEVEEQFEQWLKTQVGRSQDSGLRTQDSESDPFAKEKVIDYLESKKKSLIELAIARANGNLETKDGLYAALLGATADLVNAEIAFRATPSAPKLEAALTMIERELDDAITMAAVPEQVMEAREKVESALAGYARQMPESVYEKTFGDLLTKRLREMFGVPRLSLFYMKG